MPTPSQDWPVAQDVLDRLAEAGIPQPGQAAPGTPRVTRSLAKAIATAERELGWFPFLNRDTRNDQVPGTGPAITTRIYDPPGPRQPGGLLFVSGGGHVLRLDAGIISDPTLASTIAVTVNGAVYLRDVQFWLEPYNAPARNQPYTMIRFLVSPWGPAHSLNVTAPFGYCSALPDDMFEAATAKACSLLGPEISGSRSGGRASWTERDVSEKFAQGRDAGAYAHEIGRWDSDYQETIDNYARTVLW